VNDTTIEPPAAVKHKEQPKYSVTFRLPLYIAIINTPRPGGGCKWQQADAAPVTTDCPTLSPATQCSAIFIGQT